jgi:hypothetical protein
MPVIIGTKQIANFTTQSYPLVGTLLIGIFAAGVIGLTGWYVIRGSRPIAVDGFRDTEDL